MRAEQFFLSNGIDVVYLQLPKSQQHRLLLNVPVGSAHDPAEKEGLCHVLEHTVLCGTETTPETEFSSKLRRINSNWNAHTSADATVYDFSASTRSAENLHVLADILREVITEPLLDPERVEIEKRVIINELYDGMDNLIRHPAFEISRAMHVGKNPYTNIIGTEKSVSATTSKDLKAFIRENYDAGHMILYAAGPLSRQAAADVFEQTLSAIPNLGRDPKPRHEMCNGPADIRITRPDLHQNYSALMFSFPNARDSREKYIELEAVSHVSSFLVETLRRKHGCFYSPASGGWATDKSTRTAFLSMSNTPENSTVACHAMLDFYKSMDSILTDDILTASLEGEKFSLSDPDRIGAGILDAIQSEYEGYGTLFDREEVIAMIGTIAPGEIRAKAREVVSSLTGLYVQGPEPERVPSLEFLRDAMAAPSVKVQHPPLRNDWPVLGQN